MIQNLTLGMLTFLWILWNDWHLASPWNYTSICITEREAHKIFLQICCEVEGSANVQRLEYVLLAADSLVLGR